MLPESTIWNILQENVPHGQWVSMREIYSIVESHSTLDKTDLEMYRMNTLTPAWRIRVKRLLDQKKAAGKIQGRKRI
jgi:hypothetical protein